VTEDQPDLEGRELEGSELLVVIGQVSPPTPDALQDAREVLWAALAQEMLAAGAAADAARTGARETGRPQQIARRRRTDPGS
jgi:hypothetical protein